MDKPLAIQFGAGNIGRGFTGQLFFESGMQTVFIDAVPALVDALNAEQTYTVHIVGEQPESIPVADVRALLASDTSGIEQAFVHASIACTAVGVNILPRLGAPVAAGLAARWRAGVRTPLNILICENQMDAHVLLRNAVIEALPAELRDHIDMHTGFALCVVSRMVPVVTDEQRRIDPLGVRVEAYKRLPVSARALKPPVPAIVGLEPVANFQGHEERKLFVHNAAHALLGYLGWPRGHEYVWQAVADTNLRQALDAAMAEVNAVLVKRHGFDPADQQHYYEDLLQRFSNRELGDTVARVARDPMRKLRRNDRLVGAAELVQDMGGDAVPVCRAIAAAFRYNHPDDPSARELQKIRQQGGAAAVLEQVCGLPADHPLHQTVLRCDREMAD